MPILFRGSTEHKLEPPAPAKNKRSGFTTHTGLWDSYNNWHRFKIFSRIAPFCAGPLDAAELQPYSVQALPAQGGGELCGLPGIQGQGQRQTEGQRPGTGLSSSAT